MPAREMTTMEALGLWHRVNEQAMRQLSYDLSSRQMAILLSVYLQPGPHTIKSLSQELDVSKAAVCRAVDMLSAAELLRRKKDTEDKRNVFIQRTVNGSVYLSDFADLIMKELERKAEEAPALQAAAV